MSVADDFAAYRKWACDEIQRLKTENAELNETTRKHVASYYEVLAENSALREDKERLDFLSTLTGSGWACLHLDQKGSNDDWFLTRKQIDRRMATEPKQ